MATCLAYPGTPTSPATVPMMGKAAGVSAWTRPRGPRGLSVGALCVHGDSCVPLLMLPVLELCARRVGVSVNVHREHHLGCRGVVGSLGN